MEGLSSPVQRAVGGALLRWRDGVCREEDEGIGYVLPRAQLITLAKNMPGGCLACERT
jgi:ribonuclease D